MMLSTYTQQSLEAVILNCLITEGAKITDAMFDATPAELFRDKRSKIVYEALKEIRKNGEAASCDEYVLHSRIKDSPEITTDYLCDLFSILGRSQYYPAYVQELKRRYLLERNKRAAQELVSDIKQPIYDIDSFLASIPQRFTMPDYTAPSLSIRELAPRVMELLEKIEKGIDTGCKTGIGVLDNYFGGGLQPGLYVIGGRTHHGKTDFAIEIALGLLENGYKVRYDQLETDNEVFAKRLIGKMAGVTPGEILSRKIDWTKLYLSASHMFENLPLTMAPKTYTIEELKISCAMDSFDVLIIDQFDKIKLDPNYRYLEAKNLVVEGLLEISKSLKKPVIVMTQLNRTTDDAKPTLRDYKDTGQLEQTADVGMLLWQTMENHTTTLNVHIAKDRIMLKKSNPMRFTWVDGRLRSIY